MANDYLVSVVDISKMLGFDRRTVQSRLYVGKVWHECEQNGVLMYSMAKAAAAIYRVEFGK